MINRFADNSLDFIKVETEPRDIEMVPGMVKGKGKMNYIQRINHWKVKFADLAGKELKIPASVRAGSPEEIIVWIKRQIKLIELGIEKDA